MPYIEKDDRKACMPVFSDPSIIYESPGELNYSMVVLLNKYIKDNGHSYRTYNDIVGVLESLKMEFYRRMVAPYEEIKMRLNGDVF